MPSSLSCKISFNGLLYLSDPVTVSISCNRKQFQARGFKHIPSTTKGEKEHFLYCEQELCTLIHFLRRQEKEHNLCMHQRQDRRSTSGQRDRENQLSLHPLLTLCGLVQGVLCQGAELPPWLTVHTAVSPECRIPMNHKQCYKLK